jgi:hypothetical protein
VLHRATRSAAYKLFGSGPLSSETWTAASLARSDSCSHKMYAWSRRLQQEADIVVLVAVMAVLVVGTGLPGGRQWLVA